jgi:hypothetical protein
VDWVSGLGWGPGFGCVPVLGWSGPDWTVVQGWAGLLGWIEVPFCFVLS